MLPDFQSKETASASLPVSAPQSCTKGVCVFMKTARPRLISQVPAGSLPERASSRSIQKSVPPFSASYMACRVLPVVIATGGAGIADPENVG